MGQGQMSMSLMHLTYSFLGSMGKNRGRGTFNLIVVCQDLGTSPQGQANLGYTHKRKLWAQEESESAQNMVLTF